MDRLALLEHRVALIEQRLAGFSPVERQLVRDQPIAMIVAEVAVALDLDVADILDRRHSEARHEARLAVSWVALNAGFGPSKVGRAINRDHTLPRSNAASAERRRVACPRFKLLTDRLLAAANDRRTIR